MPGFASTRDFHAFGVKFFVLNKIRSASVLAALRHVAADVRRRKPVRLDSTSLPRWLQIRSRDSTAFGAPTTKPPMKFAICNEIFQEWKIEDTFACAARTGYDAVEIAPFTIAKYVTDISAGERQRIRETAARAGIAISGIHWVLAQTDGLHLIHPETAVREKTSRYLCDLVDFCADLGGNIMVFGSPKQRSIPEGVTPKEARDCAVAAFQNPVRQAGERDVTICFEPLSAAETNFINTAAEAIQFAQLFNSPHFKILLDVKAMCAEPKPIPHRPRPAQRPKPARPPLPAAFFSRGVGTGTTCQLPNRRKWNN